MSNYLRLGYYVASLMRHIHWDSARLTKYQNKRLREIVRYAYDHVEFYHQKMRESRVKPEDVRTVEDLNRLPILSRNELQTNSERLISDEFDCMKLRVISTSGSTGRPFFTHLSKKEDEFRKAKLLRPHLIYGQKPWDRWVMIAPLQHGGNINWLQRLFGLYLPVFVSVFDDPAEQVSRVKILKPEVLDGYSNSLLLMAKEIERTDADSIRPRFVMGGAELIGGPSRRLLQNVFQAPFYDQYASEELQMIAWQCPHDTIYHIDADTLIVQFVDKDGQEVACGEKGEIVCTSLFNYAMPFIRYALDDVGVPSKSDDCPCGIVFPLMKLIEGRKDSMVVLPDGRVVAPLVFGWMMEFYKYYREVYQYRIIQSRINQLRVLLKKKENTNADETTMKTELLKHMRSMLNIDEAEAHIEVEFVPDIPFDRTGKLRKVISEIKGSRQNRNLPASKIK